MFRGLSRGDDANLVVALRVDDHDNALQHGTDRHEPFLSVVDPIVFYRPGESVKHRHGVDEIDSVFLYVSSSLGFVPIKVRTDYCSYKMLLRQDFSHRGAGSP